MPGLKVEIAPPAMKETLRPLARAYARELCLVTGLLDGRDPADEAAFEMRSLDRYWQTPDRRALVIRSDEAVAGFALLNQLSFTGQPTDWNLAEFYVVPAFRRVGLGSRAATAILLGNPGVWEVGVLAGNYPARVFWPKVIAQVVDGPIEEVWDDDGPIYRFSAGVPWSASTRTCR